MIEKDKILFKKGVIKYIQQWASSEAKPIKAVDLYTPEIIKQRKASFVALHKYLCDRYCMTASLKFNIKPGRPQISDLSCYRYLENKIVLRGKFSLLTYLHEFAHALLRDGSEPNARAWSQALFKRALPKTFAALRSEYGNAVFRGRIRE